MDKQVLQKIIRVKLADKLLNYVKVMDKCLK